ncbi:hypothetical protein TNCV_4496251 [Trichonephila clavipes]|nr:hypothetical protein TNCV_4496251 [Trichonephila clavipes]
MFARRPLLSFIPDWKTTCVCAANSVMNCGHRQRNGTTLGLLTNPASACNIMMIGRIPVWRHREGRLLNCCVMHRHTGPAPNIMVSGGIGFHNRAPLVCIAGATSLRC